MSTSITTPVPSASGTTRVQIPYGGTSPGVICARGMANLKNTEFPTEVWGKILTTTTIPPDPPSGSTPGRIFSDGRTWEISKHVTSDIPNALCGSARANAASRTWPSLTIAASVRSHRSRSARRR